jgi:hypothetical protein
VICSKCGKENQVENTFCENCKFEFQLNSNNNPGIDKPQIKDPENHKKLALILCILHIITAIIFAFAMMIMSPMICDSGCQNDIYFVLIFVLAGLLILTPIINIFFYQKKKYNWSVIIGGTVVVVLFSIPLFPISVVPAIIFLFLLFRRMRLK